MDISKLGTDKIQQERTGEAQKSKKAQGAFQENSQSNASQSNASQSASATSQSAKVNWSPKAKLAQEALALAKASPDVRADKVAALKAAIADGTYKVDSKSLADKMISSSLEDELLTRNG